MHCKSTDLVWANSVRSLWFSMNKVSSLCLLWAWRAFICRYSFSFSCIVKKHQVSCFALNLAASHEYQWPKWIFTCALNWIRNNWMCCVKRLGNLLSGKNVRTLIIELTVHWILKGNGVILPLRPAVFHNLHHYVKMMPWFENWEGVLAVWLRKLTHKR